jgi:hypothetical protein
MKDCTFRATAIVAPNPGRRSLPAGSFERDAPRQGGLIEVARKAGAFIDSRPSRRLLLALLAALCSQPLLAAEVRLLHADPATVRSQLMSAADPANEMLVRFEGQGRTHELRLRQHPGLGELAQRLDGRAQAYRGQVGAAADSWAAVTRIGNRWSGIWYDGGEFYAVDTAGALAGASDTVAALDPRQLVVYRLRDAWWDDLSLEGDTLPVPRNGAQIAGQLKGGMQGIGFGEPGRLSLALVADAQLARQDGDAVEVNLLARLNLIDGLFSNQLGVHISAGSITIYHEQADEPFGRTTDASDLLGEIASWRAGNAGQRAAGLTHVFTGRNLQGRTVGMAFIDSLCDRRYSASLSQATSSTTFAALIAAHEIGHVFGAPHDGDDDAACAATPTDYLMSPRINGSQQFSQCSRDVMARRIEAASCLSPLQGGGVPGGGFAPGQGGGGSPGLPMLAMLALLTGLRWRAGQMRANQSVR